MALTQENRLAAIETPLGTNEVVLTGFTASEQLGRLFEIEADLLSENHNIVFDDIIGQNVTIRLESSTDEPRYFNGFVSRFVQSPTDSRYARYRATIVPWLWFLTRTADCRIFQNKSIPDIIEAVFKVHKFDAFERKLFGSYTPWEYCVQYRETDFNFVSRLMEQEGIYYYFKHENGKHTCVLADSKDSHADFAGYDKIAFRPPSTGTSDLEHIRDWTINKELQPGQFVHTDFDPENPKTNLISEPAIVSREHAHSEYEIFDYPGEYAKPADGNDYAKVRIQELQARHELAQGQTDARGVCVGYTFELQDLPREDQNRKYLFLSATHSYHTDSYETGGGGGGGDSFSCSFNVMPAMPASEPFRSARITPKPLIQGPQTALVVGPKGEEIHTDKFGRVKVKFHWDRQSKADENSSCWIRVAHAWAGKKWGAIYTPRIGQEVIVEFLEGDPDLPIITGRVYNGEAMPPYDPQAKPTLSTVKSNSSKGGGGFNEIRFEDKKGEEQVFIHGEKNLDIRIKNDAFEFIGNDAHLIVKKDQIDHVENNRSETVDKDHMEKIGKDRHLKIVGKEAKEVGESHSFVVKGDVIEVFKAKHSEQTTGDYYLKAANVVIEAMTNVTIKVGASYIAIEAGGIKISAPQIQIEGTAMAEMKSPLTTVKGDGTLTLKGGVTLIN